MATGSSSDQAPVPVATPSRALAEFWGKFRKPKSHYNPMIPSSGTTTENLGKPSSSSSVETNAIESGWRYEEKCQARMARMAEAVPGNAPAYEGPSIPDVEEATTAMANVTIAAPTVMAPHPPVEEPTPGVDVTNSAPAVIAPPTEPPLPSPEPLVDTGKHGGDQAMEITPVAPEEPPLPTPEPLVDTGKHGGDQAMATTPVAPEATPVLYADEMDLIREFQTICASPRMTTMIDQYEKKDQLELDTAVAQMKNHVSLPHFEAYITTLQICEGVPGPYKFGTENQIEECASFEAWLAAEEICKGKNQSHGPSVPTAAEGKPLGEPGSVNGAVATAPTAEPPKAAPVAALATVLTRATTLDLAQQPPVKVEKEPEQAVQALQAAPAGSAGSSDQIMFKAVCHKTNLSIKSP